MALDRNSFKLAVITNTLQGCRVFKGLPQAEIDEVAAISVLRSLAKDEFLFHEGATVEGFYVVQKGAVTMHRTNDAGKEQVLHVFRAGDAFAEAALTMEDGYGADARATEPSTVVVVPKAPFLGMLRAHPEFALRLLAAMSRYVRILSTLVDDLMLKDMETRLANWLLRQCPRPLTNAPTAISLEQTKKVLAAEMGATSETYSRALARLRDQGLLRVEGTELTVTRPLDLLQLLDLHLATH